MSYSGRQRVAVYEIFENNIKVGNTQNAAKGRIHVEVSTLNDLTTVSGLNGLLISGNETVGMAISTGPTATASYVLGSNVNFNDAAVVYNATTRNATLRSNANVTFQTGVNEVGRFDTANNFMVGTTVPLVSARASFRKDSNLAWNIASGTWNNVLSVRNGNTSSVQFKNSMIAFGSGGADEAYFGHYHTSATDGDNHNAFVWSVRRGGTRYAPMFLTSAGLLLTGAQSIDPPVVADTALHVYGGSSGGSAHTHV